MGMKWFNLPGAKEAYLQDVKLKWVSDQNLDIPWIKFYAAAPTNWDFFTLAFPEQAWILKQLHAIDRDIDETLASLERLVPSSCKPKSWNETSIAEENFSGYYQNVASMQRQRELILHYAKILNFQTYDENDTDRIRLQTFRSTCIELVETARLRDRAKLIKELLSRGNTAALLSAQTGAKSPIWDVRREAIRRGSMIRKAMKKMVEAFDNEEYNETDYVDDEEDENEDGVSDVSVEESRVIEQELSCGQEVAKCACSCEACIEQPAVTVQEDSDPDQKTGGSQCELPVRSSNSGTIVAEMDHEMEGDWTSVVDENESGGR
jgi:hypothetical protein